VVRVDAFGIGRGRRRRRRSMRRRRRRRGGSGALAGARAPLGLQTGLPPKPMDFLWDLPPKLLDLVLSTELGIWCTCCTDTTDF